MPDELSKLKRPDPPPQVASQRVNIADIIGTSPEDATTAPSTQASANEDSALSTSNSRWPAIFETAPEIAQHTVSLLLSLLSLWIIHLTLKYLLGEPKFFGLIPVQWIIDVGDIVILVKFIWHLVKNFNK